jgi:hypothetical protein
MRMVFPQFVVACGNSYDADQGTAIPFSISRASFDLPPAHLLTLLLIGRRSFGITHFAIFAPNSSPSLLFPQNRMLLGFQQCFDESLAGISARQERRFFSLP